MTYFASWSASQWCAAIGCLLIVSSIISGFYYVPRRGKRRRKTHQELKERILNDAITDMPTYSVAGPGAGVKVEASLNTDTLRKHAARGEWALFCTGSLLSIGWTSGAVLLFVTMLIESDVPLVFAAVIVLFAPFALAALFAPFAALYTRIDAGADDDVVELPDAARRR